MLPAGQKKPAFTGRLKNRESKIFSDLLYQMHISNLLSIKIEGGKDVPLAHIALLYFYNGLEDFSDLVFQRFGFD